MASATLAEVYGSCVAIFYGIAGRSAVEVDGVGFGSGLWLFSDQLP